jgi:hypothetical protein
MHRGVPTQVLIQRYHWLVPSWTGEAQPELEQVVLNRWRLLRLVGHVVFKDLRELPDSRRIEVPVNPSTFEQMSGAKEMGNGSSSSSKAIFRLNALQHVLAVRIRCSIDNGKATTGAADFRVSWVGRTQTEESERLHIDAAPGEKVLTAWVDDWIDQFTIHFDNKAGVIKILKLGVLVPTVDEAVP